MNIEINRILVPLDFTETSDYAVEKASRIAAKLGAKLYLIHVMEMSPYKLVQSEENPKEKVVYQKNVMDRLEKLTNSLTERHHIDVFTLIGEAKVADAIEEAVEDNKIDLIVMGTNGASGVREFLIGSNAQRVINRSACPVITFRIPPSEFGFKTVVLPVEEWNNSIEKLDYVNILAKLYNSDIHLLGIIESNKFAHMKRVLEYLNSAEEYLKQAGISFTRRIIASQQIAKETLSYAEEIKANLIMVMTEHESRLANVLPGVLARNIVNHSNIPVMSIKPALYNTAKVHLHETPVHNRKDHSNINS